MLNFWTLVYIYISDYKIGLRDTSIIIISTVLVVVFMDLFITIHSLYVMI